MPRQEGNGPRRLAYRPAGEEEEEEEEEEGDEEEEEEGNPCKSGSAESTMVARIRGTIKSASQLRIQLANSSFVSSVSNSVQSMKNKPTGHKVVYGNVCGFLTWLALITSLLMSISMRYMYSTRDQARQRYIETTADRLKYWSSSVMSYALAARDAVDYAIQHQRYYDPADYESLRAACEPIFAQSPHLRVIDLAFNDRQESISVRRLLDTFAVGRTPNAGVMMQTDSEDCRQKLGHLGCLAAEGATRQPWYEMGMEMSDGDFGWMPSPEFLPAAKFVNESCNLGGRCLKGEVDEADTVAWIPAYILVFRSLFPGTYGSLSAVGRVVLDLSLLRKDDPFDDGGRLGQYGAAFFCDQSGALIAAAGLGAQVRVLSTAMLQFRKAWESVDVEWAGELQEAWPSLSAGGATEHFAGRFHFVGRQLEARGLENFYIVVVVDRTPFDDETLMDLASFAVAWSWCPYPVLIIIWCICWVVVRNKRKRLRKSVPWQPKEVDFAFAGY